MSDFPKDEIRETYRRYVQTREQVQAGTAGWETLADFFTDDAVFIDPAWGRIDGIAQIREFLRDSMAGLDGWTFPHQWDVVEGNRIVALWMNRLPGTREDGTHYEAPGVSILEYAGDGKFSSETDILNMVHIFELLGESGWTPSPEVNMPPQNPRRW